MLKTSHHHQRFMSEDQWPGPPTTWDDDSLIVLADPTSPEAVFSDDRRTRSMPATNDDVLRTTRDRPCLSASNAMTRCLLRRGPPALHAIDGSRIAALLHTPCWLHCVPAQDGAKGIEGQASVSPSRTCTMSASCWLPGSVLRCALDAARR
jgi:hypothetical protein